MSQNSTPTGKLIVFEGPDGVGKSTLSQGTLAALQADGIRCEMYAFPGREPGTIGKLAYDVHHTPERFDIVAVTHTANQALHIAAHLDAIERRIKPLLADGINVVLDRFWWSTWVYGLVSGMRRGTLSRMIETEREHWKPIQPAIAFLIRRDAPIDRDDPLPYWRKFRDEYDKLAEQELPRYPVVRVANMGTLAEALTAIRAAIPL